MCPSDHFLPYGRQTITEDDISAVVDALRSPFLTQGPLVPQFEEIFASKVGARYGVAVNSATSALHLACLALGLGRGDRLWTSPITFVASANCGRYCNAEVDFVDVDLESGLISIDALISKLEYSEKNSTLPKVLVPVHLCGTSCDMSAIYSLAERYGFAVLEDASHAVGGRYRGVPVGSCSYSSITVFSFHPVKIITTGEGGLATSNDEQLVQRMIDLRSHGIVKDHTRFDFSAPGPWSYEQQELGYNYRMSDLQAALGISQLQRLDAIISERNRQVDRYRQLLSELPVEFLTVPQSVLSSFHLAVVRLLDGSPENHLSVFEGMRAAGIGVQLHYTPVHLQPYYRRLGFHEGQFPSAEQYARSAISLPLFPGLSDQDQQRVARTLDSLIVLQSHS